MVDFKNWTQKAKNFDAFLDEVGKILKKHWKLLAFLGICYFFYWALTDPEFDETYPEEDYYEDQWDYDYSIEDTVYYDQVK